jgi:DNA-binding response OmpR family regulator
MQQTKDDHAGKKVLIVDDERVLTDTIGYNLRRAGYATVAAYAGRAALISARRERPAAT